MFTRLSLTTLSLTTLSPRTVRPRPALPAARRRHTQRGAALVEYVLLVALIAAVCAVAVTTLGTNVNTKLTTAAGTLK